MTNGVIIRRLDAAETGRRIAALSDVLIDCVEGGASVNFMLPMSRATADAFWRGVHEQVEAGSVALLAAEVDGALVGTVQVVPAKQENQPHRADVAKMLVRRSARKAGIGEKLMVAAEALAREMGKTLLVLDTASAEADRLYRRCGWVELGAIPGYALLPDGEPCAATFFYKQIRA